MKFIAPMLLGILMGCVIIFFEPEKIRGKGKCKIIKSIKNRLHRK